jgi:hypothetical protein
MASTAGSVLRILTPIIPSRCSITRRASCCGRHYLLSAHRPYSSSASGSHQVSLSRDSCQSGVRWPLFREGHCSRSDHPWPCRNIRRLHRRSHTLTKTHDSIIAQKWLQSPATRSSSNKLTKHRGRYLSVCSCLTPSPTKSSRNARLKTTHMCKLRQRSTSFKRIHRTNHSAQPRHRRSACPNPLACLEDRYHLMTWRTGGSNIGLGQMGR